MVSARIFLVLILISRTYLHRNLCDSLDVTIVDDYSFHQLKPSYSKQSLVVDPKKVTLIFWRFLTLVSFSFVYFWRLVLSKVKTLTVMLNNAIWLFIHRHLKPLEPTFIVSNHSTLWGFLAVYCYNYAPHFVAWLLTLPILFVCTIQWRTEPSFNTRCCSFTEEVNRRKEFEANQKSKDDPGLFRVPVPGPCC